jgi:L-arabinose isomerase
MSHELGRREFLQASVAGGVMCFTLSRFASAQAAGAAPALISPGCRGTKVKVARLYLVGTNKMWPTPTLDVSAERKRYEAEFDRMKDDFADVDFVVDEAVQSADDVRKLADKLKGVDGILAIHLNMGMSEELKEILAAKKPTVIFAIPYSGHEWSGFGSLRRQPEGALLECMLTADMNELAAAVRPFRAIHHLREAKILNVTTRKDQADYAKSIKDRFGTEVMTIDLARMLKTYESVPEADAQAEADRWIKQAQKVVEPSKDEILRSCRLALAFEKLLNEEKATVITVDCYGSMYRQLPAFPCVGFVRLNNMGLGGICESDLVSAVTHIVLQGLSGRPTFISDPTMDTSTNSIILAHCLGSYKMDGPKGEAAPYRLRTIMERQEGCVPQVFMRKGQKVTQARLIGTNQFIYFTGDIIDAPDDERGCRTKITVKVDGSAEKLWENWSNGLHRSTVYGDLTRDLQRFCRYTGIQLVNEAEQMPKA